MNRFAFFPSVGEYPVYDDVVYDALGAGDARQQAYLSALASLAPGRCVLDVGTGRDALWALAAARAGARHVYAVEALPSVAAAARAAVSQAGLSDVVTVVSGRAERVSLPVKVDLCVSEIVGNIASSEGAVAVLADVRRRLCAPECAWIPASCATRVAAVDLRTMPAVPTQARRYLDRVEASAGRPFTPRLCLAGPVGDLLISTAGTVEELSFGGPPAPDGAIETTLTVRRRHARLTGLLLWVTVHCAPSAEVDVLAGQTRGWAPVYVPVSSGGIPVDLGDDVRLRFTRTTSDDGVHPDYTVDVWAGDRHQVWRSPHHRR
jgi:protein arginine N-methyltransferase 1